uniref:Uncharacterized protein n=1 Tax=Picea sitchensis TaxID=3332 RepID=D5ABJ5_PICSI|nr:unknown [Picea sitchensis]
MTNITACQMPSRVQSKDRRTTKNQETRETLKTIRFERIPSVPSPLQMMKISSKSLWFTSSFEATV